uniref:Uncharacterized protein n=1 Tax=Parascaris univalens TaxID=6257 RepID=A0A914ZQ23_PARUN
FSSHTEPMEGAQSSTADNTLSSKSSNMLSKSAVTTIKLEPSARNLQCADELQGVQPGLPFFYERTEEALKQYYLPSAPSSYCSGDLKESPTFAARINKLCGRARSHSHEQSMIKRIFRSVFFPLVILVILFVVILVTKEAHIIDYTHN